MLKINSINDVARLANGVLMPRFGLGVWKAGDEEVVSAIGWAVEAGYRHVDSASIYGNEKGVGRGLKNCGVSRHDLFITSKLRAHDQAAAECEQTLRDLQTDYLDLYLIHWPRPYNGDEYVNAWKSLEKLYREGKVRAIGVANFYAEHIEKLRENCDILPMVNQFECHPYYQNEPLRKYCADNGIQYEAYSPLGGGAIFEDQTLKAIAVKYHKSIAQVVLRYTLERGIVVIPKSVNRDRIASNADVFDFTLDKEDMEKIRALDQDMKVVCSYPDMTGDQFRQLKAERMAKGARF